MGRAGEIDAAAARLVWLQRDEVAVAVFLTLLERKGA